MTLLEVMIAFSIFTIVAGGALTAIIQTRKMAEDNVAMAIARTQAQGIIEQARYTSYSDLTNIPEPTSGPKPLLLKAIRVDAANVASIEDTQLVWGSANFRTLGPLSDLANFDSGIGILLDSEYRAASGAVIRPARYMQMQARISRDLTNLSRDFVVVTLTYRWQPPSRNRSGGAPVWLTREIRTSISQASNF